nr:MAG TPA: hypothetical protein [Caudoviricetes sp.]
MHGHTHWVTVGLRRTQPETIVVEAESGPQRRRPTPFPYHERQSCP